MTVLDEEAIVAGDGLDCRAGSQVCMVDWLLRVWGFKGFGLRVSLGLGVWGLGFRV